jgi:hypothetical protein
LWLLGAGVVACGALAGVVAWKRRKTPEQRERERRLLLASRGRIAEGTILGLRKHETGRVVLYEYSVSQVTYNAGQDLSTLPEVRLEPPCEGLPARVKYDPQNPSDSIVVCEKWSGL